MSPALSWLWTRFQLHPLWRHITLSRYRSELRALRAARYMPAMAIFPIFLTVSSWFFLLAGLPSLVFFLLLQLMTGVGAFVGAFFFALYAVFGFVATVIVAPWFFRWYFIAAGLMFGWTDMADKKEAELIAAIDVNQPG